MIFFAYSLYLFILTHLFIKYAIPDNKSKSG